MLKLKMYKRIVYFLITICIVHGEINVDFRIVGGTPAAIQDFPYQVSLQYKWSDANVYQHICGGTLIRPSVILTAAHCVINGRSVIDPKKLKIMAGNNMWNAIVDVQRIGVRKIIHHDLQKNFDNDIALIHTSQEFKIRKTVKLIPYRRTSTHVGENCTVSGWGYLTEDKTSSIRLMKVNVPIYDQNQCENSYSQLTSNMICAGEKKGGKDACQGDSGGPLVCNGEVAGIVSFGVGCARPDFPGVYTNVARYANWIDLNAKAEAGTLTYSIIMTILMLYLLKISTPSY